jgi:alpha-N-arabinofuranosidase
MSGNFTLREEFDGSALAPYWLFVRTPQDRWHDLASTPGALTIRARSDHIGRNQQPSFVARRQQHMVASVSTAMHYRPVRPGDRAGLVAFQSDDFHFFFGLAMENGKTVLRLDRRAGPDDDADGITLASVPLDLKGDAPLRLRIDARKGLYDFSYGISSDEWVLLKKDADGTILSTQRAGGFVGTVIGMYAYRADN